jgi:hypothetical protein
MKRETLSIPLPRKYMGKNNCKLSILRMCNVYNEIHVLTEETQKVFSTVDRRRYEPFTHHARYDFELQIIISYKVVIS